MPVNYIGRNNLYSNFYGRAMNDDFEFSSEDYVKLKLGRTLNKFRIVEENNLKLTKKLEIEKKLIEKWQTITNKCKNVMQSDNLVKAESSDATIVKFVDGDAKAAENIKITVKNLHKPATILVESMDMNLVSPDNNNKIATTSNINNGNQINENATLATINGVEIKAPKTKTYTLDNLIHLINENSNKTGVVVKFSYSAQKLCFIQEKDNTNNNGLDMRIQINHISDEQDDYDDGPRAFTAASTAAEAVVKVFGKTIAPADYKLDGNILEIDNAKFKLLKVDNKECSFQKSTEKPTEFINNLENMINAFNDTRKKTNELYSEMPNKKAKLPTADEYREMEEEKIEKIEREVCKGLFNKDSSLNEFHSSTNSAFATLSRDMPGIEIYKTLFGLSVSYDGNGKIVKIDLDKAKLTNAITDGINDGVSKLTSEDVVNKIHNYCGDLIKACDTIIKQYKSSNTEQKLLESKTKMNDMIDEIERKESYWTKIYNKQKQKIDAMEDAIENMEDMFDNMMGTNGKS